MKVNLTMRDSDSGQVELRELVPLGLKPILLIEPSPSEDDPGLLDFDIDVTDLDQNGLVSVLRLLADLIEGAEEVDEHE